MAKACFDLPALCLSQLNNSYLSLRSITLIKRGKWSGGKLSNLGSFNVVHDGHANPYGPGCMSKSYDQWKSPRVIDG